MTSKIKKSWLRAASLSACLLLTAAAATSCASDEEPVFDQSAAQRLSQSVSTYKELLQGSQNGWLMNYFPNDGKYGGFAYAAHFFANGEVELRSTVGDCLAVSFGKDKYTSEDSYTSLYDVISEQAVVLTFDTYSPLLHVITEPQGSTNPDGFGGDYEFVFQRVSSDQDTIVLTGKRFGGEVRLTRLDVSPEAYITKAGTHQFIVGALPDTVPLVVGGQRESLVRKSYEHLEYIDADSAKQSVPYVATAQGFRLMEPITTYGGATLQDFVFNNTTNYFESADGTAYVHYDFPEPEAQVPFPLQDNQRYAFVKGDDEIEDCLSQVDAMWTLYIGATWSSGAKTTIPVAMGVRWYSSPLSIHGTFGCNWEKDEATHTMTIEATGEEYMYDVYKNNYGKFVYHVCDYSPYTYEYVLAGPAVSHIRCVSQKDPAVWFLLKKI